ncbi:MAG TPA: hypothetical protein PKL78_13070 [Anaerolineales bacterium]|nr:hypothetical protein [Anaerolineales bacterium]HNN14487.1 hypothetical protein [Anaerolineales bacterium]
MNIKKTFLSLVLFICVGCNNLVSGTSYSSAKQLPFPTERGYSRINLIDDQIVVFDREGGRLYYSIENNEQFEQIPDKRMDFCPDDDFYKFLSYSPFVTVLPDQRIGIIGACFHNVDYMFAYDIETGKMEKIVEEQLLVPANNFSWNPTMTMGVQDSYTQLDGTIFWLNSEEASAMDITLSDGNRSWSLAMDFPKIVGDGRQGIAAYPVWSPDGKQIAFFATFDSIGKSGFSILDSEYAIYTMDSDTLVPTQILNGIYTDYAITLAWSPDGEYISFTGKYGFPKQYGLWVLNLESKNVYFIDNNITGSVWRNDDESIIGIKCIGNSCEKQEVWEYWLKELK